MKKAVHKSKIELFFQRDDTKKLEVLGRGKLRHIGAGATAHVENTLDTMSFRGNGKRISFRKGGYPQTVHRRPAHDRVERDDVVAFG